MKKITVIYWSGTGNTEKMAEAMFETGLELKANSSLISVEGASQGLVDESDYVALGCPSMGAEVLEESHMEPFIFNTDFTGKKVFLFGSYGWGNGEWMEDWVERMKNVKNAEVFGEGYIVNGEPSKDELKECQRKIIEFLED